MRCPTVAKRRAASTISAAFTPVIASTASGVYTFTDSASAVESLASVRRQKSRSAQPFAMIALIMPLIRATSVPGLLGEPEMRVIDELDPPRVGDDQLGPVLPDRLLDLKGDDGVVLGRVRADHEDVSGVAISSIELVIAPLPNAIARPATVELCQRRAQ